jgi:hypothetical protein
MADSVKERPVLFSAAMVRALLDGRKTQTRRIVKPQPQWVYADVVPVKTPDADPKGEIRCPYGMRGDRLWVRETWLELDRDHYNDPGLPRGHLSTRYGSPRRNGCAYRAETDREGDEIRKQYGYHWRPSIHMPRWASRLLLEVTDVRVERLQDISEADAIAEGVSYTGPYPHALASGFLPRPDDLARREFRRLWESINGAGLWDANPWVWVVSFRRVQP